MMRPQTCGQLPSARADTLWSGPQKPTTNRLYWWRAHLRTFNTCHNRRGGINRKIGGPTPPKTFHGNQFCVTYIRIFLITSKQSRIWSDKLKLYKLAFQVKETRKVLSRGSRKSPLKGRVFLLLRSGNLSRYYCTFIDF